MSGLGKGLGRQAGHVLLCIAAVSVALVLVVSFKASRRAAQSLDRSLELRRAELTLTDIERDLAVARRSTDPTAHDLWRRTTSRRIDDLATPVLLTPAERRLLAPLSGIVEGHPAVVDETVFMALAGLEASIESRAQALALDGERVLRRSRVVAVVATLTAFAAMAAAAFEARSVRQRTSRRLWLVEHEAHTDPLTALPNRRRWERALREATCGGKGAVLPLTVAIIDLDHFKAFNDAHGHLAGDELLREAAKAWTELLAADDLLVRLGGEEFGLLLRRCDASVATVLLEQLRRRTPQGQSFSAGVATSTGEDTPHDLFARADHALYRAKRAGRSCTVVADEPITATTVGRALVS